jgi:hypothetical protein
MDVAYFLAVAPTWLSALLVVVLPTVLVAAGPFLLRRFLSFEQQVISNEIAGFTYGTLGVIYAVLLGLTVIAVWEQLRDAQHEVERETGALVSLYRLAEAIDPALQDVATDKISRYVALELDEEWPTLDQGRLSPAAIAALRDISTIYSGHEPRTRREELMLEVALNLLTELHKSRQARLAIAEGIIPAALWGVLFGGAIIVIGFPLFFASRRLLSQSLMIGLLSLLVTGVLHITLLLDYPFSGSVQVRIGNLVCLRQPECLRTLGRSVSSHPPHPAENGPLDAPLGEQR